MTALDLQSLRKLPKVDLHRHLEGSLRLETLWEFHCRQKQTLHASFEALRVACTVAPGEIPGFAAFLERFAGLRFRYGGLDDIARLSAEAVADAAADGVIYLELRFSPVFWARRIKDVQPLTAVDSLEEVEAASVAVITGALSEALRHGIHVGFLVSLGRQFDVAVNQPSADLLRCPIGSEFRGIDLSGDERCSALPFRALINSWRAAGKGVTIHAGEDSSAAGAANVSEAMDVLRATRIGHGVRVVEDPALVRELGETGVVLEQCPTSNIQTASVTSFEAHPLKKLLASGVRVTINTDDPSISQTSLSQEYHLALTRCGLTPDELRRCALNAAHATFLPDVVKAELVKRVASAFG
ncbi:MAG TPA: adenosine deaminase [Planctomycetota bacterium]